MKGIIGNIYTGMSADLALEYLKPGEPCAKLAILFPGESMLIKKLYKALAAHYAKSSYSFFFIIESGVLPGEVVEMGRFFFLSNYYHQNSNVPFIAFNKVPGKESTNLLIQWCVDQGLEKPEINVIGQPGEVEAGCPVMVRTTAQQFLESVKKEQALLRWVLEPVIVDVDSAQEAQALQRELCNRWKSLEERNPGINKLVLHITELEKLRRTNAVTLQYLQSEVENLKVFNKELQASDETQKILNFYHTQYEVLPLWYKRMGHVIKMLMGKRQISFMSNNKTKS